MDASLLIARLLLAAVFAVAGVAKLLDRPGSRQALVGFHVPGVLVPAGGFILPFVELAVSLSLLLTLSAWWGALGAMVLLLGFVTAIGISMMRGEAPDCHCFGQIHSEPAGWSTILRNVALLVLAGFVVWQGPVHTGWSTTDWISHLARGERATLITGVAVLIAIAVLGSFLLKVLKQVSQLMARLESLEGNIEAIARGEPEVLPAVVPAALPVAPAFTLSGLYGDTVTLASLLSSGKSLFLLFASATCGPCTVALTEAGRRQAEDDTRLRVVPLISGTVDEVQLKASQLGLGNVLVQDTEVANAYGADTMPSAVIVNPDGTIGSQVAVGPDAISALFGAVPGTSESSTSPPAPPVASDDRDLLSETHATAPRVPLQNDGHTPLAARSASAPSKNGHSEAPSDLGSPGAFPVLVATSNGQNEHDIDTPRLDQNHVDSPEPATHAVDDLDHSERPESADLELLDPLKRSREYRSILSQINSLDPVESWQEDGLHFFVFELSAGQGMDGTSDIPTAVFVMQPGVDEPVSAVVVTSNGTASPDIQSLRQVDNGIAPDPNDEVDSAPEEIAITSLTFSVADADSAEVPDNRPLAPPFALSRLDGETITLDDLRVSGRPILLLFASAGCGPCTLALTEAGHWQAEHHTRITVVPVIQGIPETVQVKADQLALSDVLLEDSEVAGAYGATMPSGVLVNPDGTLGSAVAPGPDAIRALFDDTLASLSAQVSSESSSDLAESPSEPVIETQSSTDEVLSDLVPEPNELAYAGIVAPESGQNGHVEPAPHLFSDAPTLAEYSADAVTDLASQSADFELLTPLKLSLEYRTLQDVGSEPLLADSWQEDELHFFVFDLATAEGVDSTPESPTAVFVMKSGIDEPISAVVVASDGAADRNIVDLQQPEQRSNLPSIVT